MKKKISSFLTKEDGKISKKTLIKIGVIVASIAAISSVNAHSSSYSNDCADLTAPSNSKIHGNSLSLGYTQVATGTHNHCIETHSSHSQHSAHNNNPSF